MAENYRDVHPTNNCLIHAPEDTDFVTRLADGTDLKVGQLLIEGATSAGFVDPAGADAAKVGYIAIGFWDNATGNEGVFVDLPGTAIPNKARVKCAPLVSGLQFVGLLPDSTTTTLYEKLKAAAAGRVTNLATTPTVTDVLAMYVRARQALTSTADDDLVHLEVL